MATDHFLVPGDCNENIKYHTIQFVRISICTCSKADMTRPTCSHKFPS